MALLGGVHRLCTHVGVRGERGPNSLRGPPTPKGLLPHRVGSGGGGKLVACVLRQVVLHS